MWKALNWLGDNWKTIALLGIPVLISFIASILRKNESLEKKVEMKEKEIEINEEVAELGEKLKDKALEARDETIERVIDEHKETMARIAADEQERIEAIKSAEDATEAIKEVLDSRPAWQKLTPEDIRPPRFPDPSKVSRGRRCPCGSGFKYRTCHAKWWKPE